MLPVIRALMQEETTARIPLSVDTFYADVVRVVCCDGSVDSFDSACCVCCVDGCAFETCSAAHCSVLALVPTAAAASH